jgi:hypothetical protein
VDPVTWPIVELAFWNPGDPRLATVDALIADPGAPLARHGLTGIAARYAADTGAELHPDQQWWVEELAMKSLGVEGALTEVAPTLDLAGIPWFTAKGPAVAHGSYPDPSMRPYSDLDLYVPEPDRDQAVAALEALGYEKVPQVVGPLGGLPCEYHGGRFGAVVELHSHVVDNLHRRWLPPVGEWLHHVVRRELCGVEVNVLDADAHIALQAVHLGAGHRYQKLILHRDLSLQLRPGLRSPFASTDIDRHLEVTAYACGVWTGADRAVTGRGTFLSRSLVGTDPATWDEHAPTVRNALTLIPHPIASVRALGSNLVRGRHELART